MRTLDAIQGALISDRTKRLMSVEQKKNVYGEGRVHTHEDGHETCEHRTPSYLLHHLTTSRADIALHGSRSWIGSVTM